MDFSTVDALFDFARNSSIMRETPEFIVDTLFNSIADDLAILKVIVIAPPQELIEDGALQVIESIATAAESSISSYDLTYMSEEMAFELEMQLFVLLMPMRDWKKEAKKTYEERPKPSEFPKTSPLLLVESGILQLGFLLKKEAEKLGPLSHFMTLFRQKLLYVSTERWTEKYFVVSVAQLANEAICVIDSFLAKDVPMWYSVHSLLHIWRELELVDRESTVDLSSDDDIIGFKVEMKRMLELLTRGALPYIFVSVVGMAGQGKTALATKLYNNHAIIDHFDIRTCCVVSQTYKKRDVLLQLLDQTASIDTETLQNATDHELGGMLKKSLLRKKFLMYMDDIWTIDAWNDVSAYLPTSKYLGSRVIFTTRNQDLALEFQYDMPNEAVNIHPLSEVEGFELIRKKILFQRREVFPDELVEFVKQITKTCQGLPSSLVFAADILSKLEWKYDEWKQFAQKFSSYFLKQSRFYYQRTSPLVFIEHLLENLKELVEDTDISTTPIIDFVLLVTHELMFWKDRLIEILEQPNEPLHLKHLMRRITNLAYEVENIIDSFLVGDFPIWHSNWSQSILSEFEQLERKSLYDYEYVVGFKEESKMMLELLISGMRKRSVISIAGGPGQGKTTLAKKLYNFGLIVKGFDVRVWCTVSQEYKKRELILELLGQLIHISNTTLTERSDHELGNMLHDELLEKKFLLVLDDIWSISVWTDLAEYLPDRWGCKILLTTRMKDLAQQINSDSKILSISPLSNDESWELLEKKLFHEYSCPFELLEVAKKIARNCKGLPLSIISTAQILAKTEKTVERWKDIAANLTSNILADAQGEIKTALDKSYNYLPDYLKPCFLYFVVALGGSVISVSKLIRFWIAEGFIEYTELESLENKAYNHLQALIDRSLVTVAEMDFGQVPKSCQLNSLLHEYCLSKSKEDRFFQLINGYDKVFDFSNITLDHGLDPNYSSSFSSPTIYLHHRLSICSKRNHLIMLKPSGPFVRSLLFSATSDLCPSYSYDISFLLTNFKILRTLDFEDINVGDSFNIIEKLVMLRYLAVQSTVNFISSSIDNLWNLQTFIFKGLSSEGVVKIPDSFWNMTKLRHVHINDGASFDIDPHRLEGSSSIPANLQTFSTPSLSYGDVMEKILRRNGGIYKLKCIFLDSWDDVEECNKFPLLEFLNKLVSLKVIYNGIVKHPYVFSLPSNLKKLTLSKFRMPWDQISQLAGMCKNLEVLNLMNNAVEGEIWKMEKDVVFSSLTFLKLGNLNVVTVSVSSDNFPKLEHLILHKCENLEEFPEIIDANTVKVIKVMWCKRSAAISLRKIEMMLQHWGMYKFKVEILPELLDYENPSIYL